MTMRSNIHLSVDVPTETQLSFLNALTEVLKAFEGELGSFTVNIYDSEKEDKMNW